MNLEHSVSFITGAAGRIGKAIAFGIGSKGGKLVLVDTDDLRLSLVASYLNPANTLCLVADSTQPGEVERCISSAVGTFGRVDAAIHAAYPRSSGWGAKFEDLQEINLAEDLSSHLGGAILFSQKILQQFKSQGHGNLIHISSIMGVVSPRFESYRGTNMSSPIEYTAIKAGIIAVTRYLAKYYRGNNIRVNCISPGGILDGQPEPFLHAYRSHCNDKGMLDASDLVGTVLYLLSEESRYVTGQNIVIDDGWSL